MIRTLCLAVLVLHGWDFSPLHAAETAELEKQTDSAPSKSIASGKSFAPVDDLKNPLEEIPKHFVVVPGKDPNGWSFTLEPYLWSLGMSGDIGVKGLPATHVDYSTKTILQHLDWGLMARGEIRKGRWGILGDGLFAQLSADGDPPGPLYDNATVRVQQGLASLALAYRVIDDRRGFLDVYAGARYNYMGFRVQADVDSGNIQNISDNVTQRITNGIGSKVDAFIALNAAALQSAIVNSVGAALTDKVLATSAGFPGDIRDSLSRRDLVHVLERVQNRSGSLQELLFAVAQARLAAAKGTLTPAIQDQLTNAQKKFSKELARQLEKALPTSSSGDQWWVDPIVGLRGQINITRWLFLAIQSDIGGFGAGSQLAWNTTASVGVNFTRNVFGEFGYRYYYLDYSNDGALFKGAEAGLFSGIGIKF